MEKVQFQLEATLPELKDLHEKGLFTKYEIDQITKRRTALEMSLVRRVVRKEDFFKYAEYEINLERLRRVRWKRLKYDLNPPPPSASTYSLPRRTMYILKRATIKFPADLAVWLAYVEYASREGMRKVVSRGLTSALQHHPLSPTLYLLSSYHHLHPTAPIPRSAIPSTSNLTLPSNDPRSDREDDSFSLEGTVPARTTLLLGLRLLPKSQQLWREYIKLELGWVEALRRRWRILGIGAGTKESHNMGTDGKEDVIAGEGAFGPDGEDARKAILAGELVVQALSSALEGISLETPPDEDGNDGLDFRRGLLDLLRTYPSPLRSRALSLIYADLEKLESFPAKLLLLTKGLYDRPYDPEVKDVGGIVLSGVELVEEYGKIGKEIRKFAKSSKNGEWCDVAGRWLIQQMERCEDDVALREYLASTLSSLTKPSYRPPAELLCLQIDTTYVPLEVIRTHSSLHPRHLGLRKRLLVAEIEKGTLETVRSLFESTKTAGVSSSDEEEVVSIWTIYIDFELTQNHPNGVEGIWRKILKDSLRQGSFPNLHPVILGRYFTSNLSNAISILNNIKKDYQPTSSFYRIAFNAVSQAGEVGDQKDKILRLVAEGWKGVARSSEEKVDSALVWAEWLLRSGKGSEAMGVIEVFKREIGDGAGLAELEKGWMVLLDEVERGVAGNEESDGDQESDEEEEGEVMSDELEGEEEQSEEGDIIMVS